MEALNRVKSWLPRDSIVAVPDVHHLDKEANIIIMEDCGGNALTLKQITEKKHRRFY